MPWYFIFSFSLFAECIWQKSYSLEMEHVLIGLKYILFNLLIYPCGALTATLACLC